MSEKIKLHHLERKAALYVRQSSAYQVAQNQEPQTAIRNEGAATAAGLARDRNRR